MSFGGPTGWTYTLVRGAASLSSAAAAAHSFFLLVALPSLRAGSVTSWHGITTFLLRRYDLQHVSPGVEQRSSLPQQVLPGSRPLVFVKTADDDIILSVSSLPHALHAIDPCSFSEVRCSDTAPQDRHWYS
jgi:hypothetical protein